MRRSEREIVSIIADGVLFGFGLVIAIAISAVLIAAVWRLLQ